MPRTIKIKFIILVCLSILLTTSGFGCKGGDLQALKALKEPVELSWWRVFEGEDSFREIIYAYQTLHPNIRIKYRKLRFQEYEQALLEAWAEDKGPDIFTIHNTWIGKYESKILPLPEKIKLPYAEKYDRAGKVTRAYFKEKKSSTPYDIKNNFAEVVYSDSIRSNQILGLPLSLDTLALFYNRDLFNQAGVLEPPRTWLEIKEASKKMTLQDQEGNIIQSGIALGEARNINRFSDILSLLMIQNGAEMTDIMGRRATFNEPSSYSSDRSYKPGVEALKFYTDFANVSKEVYTWNKDLPYSQEAFIQGRSGMMLGYAYQIPFIKTQGPRLDFGIAPAPHINPQGTDALGKEINFANYWLETVSLKTKYPNEAWDFVLFATSKEQVISYLGKAKKPTALRALIKAQLGDQELEPFVSQILTSKSWYRGRDANAAEKIFEEMITSVIDGQATSEEAASFAVQRINQTL